MKHASLVAGGIGILLMTVTSAFAQTNVPEGVTQEQIDAALQEISTMYGAPVVRADQAKAICNEEQYFLQCAEIGKKHGLFDDDRIKQVDTLVQKLKGDVMEKLALCTDAECLIEVASSLARQLSKENSAVARAVDLTPKKVDEKRAIVDAAKEIGIDFEQCRTMDPDTATVELLRACARLAKDARIQQYIPQHTRDNAERSDASIELRESLASGALQCGDGTLEGCGNFCLNPSPEARAQGTEAIPPVCRDIAQRFFGAEGIQQLEASYATVQRTFDSFSRSQDSAFVTENGETLTSPAAIGRYLEAAGQRGDIEAIKKGMDFMVAHGFATPADRDFAIKMMEKVKERGGINFDECRANPEQCRDFVPDEDRGQFAAMGEVEKIMRSAMESRGIKDPSQCEFDPAIGARCMEAAKEVIPQLEALVSRFPEVRFMIEDLRQKVRFGEEGLAARGRTEERMRNGSLRVGDKEFRSMSELEAFCKEKPHECLAEMARAGMFARDVAAEKYQHAASKRFEQYTPEERFISLYSPVDQEFATSSYPKFDKEEAIRQFKAWLDNPEGPPPMPYGPPRDGRYPPYGPEPYPGTGMPYRGNECLQVSPRPCPMGEYRQESTDMRGCYVYGACIPIDTKTGKHIDGKFICPAMPTVESCPVGEEKVASYSSPECGTYYTCYPKRTGDTQVKFPYTFKSGKVTPSYEAARSYCYESGPNGATAKEDVAECAATFGFYVPSIPPEKQCSYYGDGWHTMDQSGNCFNTGMTEYRTPGGTLQQCGSAPVHGCTDMKDTHQQGQKEQVWNSFGLRSWIRDDADSARIDSLKQACANVKGAANVWKPNAGNSTSVDFGMPDPEKCAKAASCTASQYFNGNECVTGGGSQSCPSGQYWNGTSCSTNDTWPTTDEMKRCFYPNASKNGQYVGYTVWCEKDYFNCHEGEPSGATVSLTGLSLGAPSSCEFGGPGHNTNNTSADAPFAPTGLTAVVDGTKIKLNWSNTANAERVVTKFKVFRKPPDLSWASLGEVSTNDTYMAEASYTDASAPQTGYITYQVQACNASGCSTDSNQAEVAIGRPQCSDYKDNDSDGWIDSGDSGCESPKDNSEVYVAPTTTTTTNNNYPGDANSCPGFAYSRWDSTGKRYCQLNSEVRCDYEYPSYLTNGSNYTSMQCPAGGGTTSNNQVTGSCSTELTNLLGYGCHNMGNAWFNSAMTQYVMPGTTVVKSCSTDSISGCGGGSTTSSCSSYTTQSSCTGASSCTWNSTGNYCSYSGGTGTNTPPAGQKQQVWNSYGLQSWVRDDADPARITSLKSACANVRSTSANVWMSGAGTQSSPDFGMPDPNKCTQAAACTSDQYFNGTSCVAQGTSQSCSSYATQSACTGASGCYWNSTSNYCSYSNSTNCPSGQYWNGTACVNSGTSETCSTEITSLLGTGCHNMGNAWFNSAMTQYVMPGTTVVKNCSTDAISGCSSSSNTSSCSSYTTQSSCSGAGSCSWNSTSNYCYYGGNTNTNCPSGQYWNGTACVNSTTPEQGCTQAGGTWNSSTNYCQMPGQQSCPSGQYWNGTACVNTSTTDCPSGQHWNGSACVPDTTTCPTGQYWNGTACVNNTTPEQGCVQAGGTWNAATNSCTMPTTYAPNRVAQAAFCPSGHDWNGSYCTVSPRPAGIRNMASVISAFLSIFGL